MDGLESRALQVKVCQGTSATSESSELKPSMNNTVDPTDVHIAPMSLNRTRFLPHSHCITHDSSASPFSQRVWSSSQPSEPSCGLAAFQAVC